MISNDPIAKNAVIHSYIYWDGFFTNEELDKIIEYCNETEVTSGLVKDNGDFNKEIVNDKRVSKINFHKPNDKNIWIFNRLNELINIANERYYGFDLVGYEAIQYSTYDSSELGKYDWHIDSLMGSLDYQFGGLHRKLSMTLLLDDNFEGGEFEIKVSDPETIHCPRGRAIFFPSFLLHRVKPVTKGTRRSLVIWVLGPKWK